MNKKCLNWSIFQGLNVWNIIILVTKTKNKKGEKDDETFKTILRGVETRMSANTMHGAMRIDAVSSDGYYVLQWTSEPYTLQKY